METGILAHLSARISKQNELLATEGLTYLLQVSHGCRSALKNIIKNQQGDFLDEVSFRSEVSGEALERPDIVVTDVDGNEIGLIEGKFDAGLTENQPNQYLKRLSSQNGGFLLFVVPERRMSKLWNEVTLRANSFEKWSETEINGGVLHCSCDGSIQMMMVSWQSLLSQMLVGSSSLSETCTADVQQLQLLCRRTEGDIFLPFSSNELTSVSMPRRNEDLCNLVDGIVEDLRAKGLVDLKGLKATGQRNGYVRYVCLNGHSPNGYAAIALNYEAWGKHESSPLWIYPQALGKKALTPLLRLVAARNGLELTEHNGTSMLPLPVRSNLEMRELVEDSSQLIAGIVDMMEQSDFAAE